MGLLEATENFAKRHKKGVEQTAIGLTYVSDAVSNVVRSLIALPEALKEGYTQRVANQPKAELGRIAVVGLDSGLEQDTDQRLAA